ncbi:hypothetical protein GQ457_13G023280 [Hibiscus cannabinus]
MSAPPSVRVDDDLSSREPGITVRTTDDETARWVEVENGFLIEVLLGDDRFDYVLLQIGGDLVVGHGLVVLSGDEDGVDTNGNHGAFIVVILDGDLSLAVGSEPRAGPVFADVGEASTELGGQNVAEGHQFRSLVGGVAKHMALVTGADLLGTLTEMTMDTLSDIRALLLDINQHSAVVGIETDISGCETDVPAGVPDDLLVIHIGFCSDFTKDHHHVGLGAGLASDLAVGILRQAGVEDRIGDLIAELVGMSLVNRLRGK